MATRFKSNPPPMKYLDGTDVDLQIAQRIYTGEIDSRIIGFCSETAFNVLDLGDELIVVHSIYIDSWNS